MTDSNVTVLRHTGPEVRLVWQPTPELRFLERVSNDGSPYVSLVLQQAWFGTNGREAQKEWRDVPVFSE